MQGVRQRDRESSTDSDPHGLFFGSHDDDGHDDAHGYADGYADDGQHGALPRVERVSRSELRAERGQHAARRRNRRVLLVLAGLLVAVVAVAT